MRKGSSWKVKYKGSTNTYEEGDAKIAASRMVGIALGMRLSGLGGGYLVGLEMGKRLASKGLPEVETLRRAADIFELHMKLHPERQGEEGK